MALNTLAKYVPRFAEARCICRAFSTQLPRLYPAAPQAQCTPYSPQLSIPFNNPPAPPSYYDPAHQSQRRADEFGLAKSLANAASQRTQYNKVERYDRMRAQLLDVEKMGRAKDLEKQIHRSWQVGDVYAPHDLSSVEMEKWRKRRPREKDVFDMLGINPLKEYKVCIIHF